MNIPPTPLTIEGDVDTVVDDEGNSNTMAKMVTGICIAIPGVGVGEPGIAIPGVEEPDIKTPGVEYLYVYLYLGLDIGNPGLNIEMPLESTGPAETTGVAENDQVKEEENQGTYEENQSSSRIVRGA